MPTITALEFADALRLIGPPGGKQLGFIRAHARAKSRAVTFSQLAIAAGYRNYRAINLHYGKLARKIGDALGQPNARITLLLESHQPNAVTNREWVLVMRPEFAEALEQAGWL